MEKEGVWMALPIAIVEDQTPDAQRLEELLQQQLPEAECTWFACGDDFLCAAAEPGLYAVVFLDICMAGTNGIETARRLRQADPEVLIVFVTSSPEYVWDAFPVHPFDYLLKPYQKEKFEHLAAELRRAQVMAQMLSPAMLGLVVENRYDGMLKKQQGTLRSTKHEGTGIGLVSAETVVHKYNGNLHLETEEQIFRVNVLLNL